MSGDVQPRKRRDKKKKKEDTAEEIIIQHQQHVAPSAVIAEDLNIHVQKELSTGGGWCAKLIFFILLTILSTLIGLIITEHRGITDLDKVDAESRFTQLFEGWTDTSSVTYDYSDPYNGEHSEENDDESEEGHQEVDENDEDEDNDDHSDENTHEEEEEEVSDQEDEEVSNIEDDNTGENGEIEMLNADENEDEATESQDENEQDDLTQEYQSEIEQSDEEQGNDSEYAGEDDDEISEENDYIQEDEELEAQKMESEETLNDIKLKISQTDDGSNDDENDDEEDDEDDNEKDEIENVLDEDTAKQEEAVSNVRQRKPSSNEVKKSEEDLIENTNAENTDYVNNIQVSKSEAIVDSDSENENGEAEKRTGAQAVYDFSNITNVDDYKIREELDRAQQQLSNDAAFALTLFNKILEKNPTSPRALYGKAQALDIIADQKKSNILLEETIAVYQQVLQAKKVPEVLFTIAAERCIDRMRFKGLYSDAITIHKQLIDTFPNVAKFRNHLAVTYLTINKINDARKILLQILDKWPNDGFALVHYGFILKTADNDLNQSIKYLKKGIATKEPGVIDGRFYFHLGDALTRLGKRNKAMAVYIDGVNNKLFLSKYQRSLYNVERLLGKPWWNVEETPHTNFFKNLENQWTIIRDEGSRLLDKKGYFIPETENLRDVGEWKQFELYARGIKNVKNCQQCPYTCKIIQSFPDAIGCRRGQIKFSVMHPGTHVWPHCGPTNCRLRAHLGLIVPSKTYIRVGEKIRSWQEGKVIIFDDSFEHEVWHNGTSTRLVLIIDFWHPELTKQEKRSLSSI